MEQCRCVACLTSKIRVGAPACGFAGGTDAASFARAMPRAHRSDLYAVQRRRAAMREYANVRRSAVGLGWPWMHDFGSSSGTDGCIAWQA